MTNYGEEGMRLLYSFESLQVSTVVYGRSLSSCGRTRRMTCCPREGMLDLTKTWPWGETPDLMPAKPSLLSPLQENKQSPLLSIEEIQNGIQSPDGHKQLQVACWNFSPSYLVCFVALFVLLFQPGNCNYFLRQPSPRERSWAVRGTLRSTWWSTSESCQGFWTFFSNSFILSIRCLIASSSSGFFSNSFTIFHQAGGVPQP